MYWHQVKKIAKKYPLLHVWEPSPNLDYGNAAILSKLEKQPVPTTLYFIKLSNLKIIYSWLNENIEENGKLSFVIEADEHLDIEGINPNFLDNVIIIESSDDYSSVYQEVLKLMDDERALEYDFRILMSRLQSNLPVEEVCSEISGTLHGIPTALFDTTATLISAAGGSTSSDAVNKALREDDGFLSKVLQLVSYPATDAISPTRVYMDASTYYDIRVLPIRSGTLRIGYLAVFESENKQLSDLDNQYLGHISSILSSYLQKNSPGIISQLDQTSMLLASLFEKKIFDYATVKKQFARLGYSLHRNMRIAVVRVNDSVVSFSNLAMLGRAASRTFPGSVFFIQDQSIVLLISQPSPWHITGSLMKTYQSFAVRSGVSIGISPGFESLDRLPASRQQAQAALETGTSFFPAELVYSFDELRIHRAVSVLRSQLVDPAMSYLNPGLLNLLQYDEDHGGDLTYTLYLFLNFPKDPAFVCSILNIHKNTLYARLKKIRQFIQDDLFSMDTITQLYITLLFIHQETGLYFPLELPGRDDAEIFG